jgi:demethylmenaquinone methyltransferase/2-methoxy-6-polyprenyl-1,4-benzoquinol methylase
MTANRSKLDIVNRFFSGTGSSYDRVVVICTCGLDKYWKKKIIAKIPAYSARILDQGCGTGILTLEIARAFPGCEVTGVELRDEYLDLAREKARSIGIKNVRFILGRAEDVMPEGGFDCITSSYLAKYADLGALILNAGKMLRPDGLVIIHDFTCPSNHVFGSIWHAYLRILKIVGGRVWPEWRTVFHELPEFLRQSTWLPETLYALEEHAFIDITSEPLTFGASFVVTARKPDAPLHRTS